MAFVGISEVLRTQVRSKIRNMSSAEKDTLGADPREGSGIDVNGNEDWFTRSVWQGKPELQTLVPDTWLAQVDMVGLYVDPEWDGDFKKLNERTKSSIYCGRMKFPTPIKLPPTYRGYIPDMVIGFLPGETMPEDIKRILDYMTKVKDIKQRWEKVEEKVGEFLIHCKSLNEGLKLWPDLKVYIPKEYLERVERKTSSRADKTTQAADILSTIDTDEIQAAAVIARLSGANV